MRNKTSNLVKKLKAKAKTVGTTSLLSLALLSSCSKENQPETYTHPDGTSYTIKNITDTKEHEHDVASYNNYIFYTLHKPEETWKSPIYIQKIGSQERQEFLPNINLSQNQLHIQGDNLIYSNPKQRKIYSVEINQTPDSLQPGKTQEIEIDKDHTLFAVTDKYIITRNPLASREINNKRIFDEFNFYNTKTGETSTAYRLIDEELNPNYVFGDFKDIEKARQEILDGYNAQDHLQEALGKNPREFYKTPEGKILYISKDKENPDIYSAKQKEKNE